MIEKTITEVLGLMILWVHQARNSSKEEYIKTLTKHIRALIEVLIALLLLALLRVSKMFKNRSLNSEKTRNKLNKETK